MEICSVPDYSVANPGWSSGNDGGRGGQPQSAMTWLLALRDDGGLVVAVNMVNSQRARHPTSSHTHLGLEV